MYLKQHAADLLAAALEYLLTLVCLVIWESVSDGLKSDVVRFVFRTFSFYFNVRYAIADESPHDHFRDSFDWFASSLFADISSHGTSCCLLSPMIAFLGLMLRMLYFV